MYTLAPAPQQIFINPDTQSLAVNGFVWFYRDTDRTTIKPVYQNTGTPNNPVYTQAPLNPDGSLSLNASGAFPFFIYYYPFDDNGNYDLYYVVAKTSDGIQILAEGNYPTIADIEVISQLVYFIGTACSETPSLADKTQLAEAVSQYTMLAPYFVDSLTPVVNTYVAKRRNQEEEELPCELQSGLRVRFLPQITNTGASTFTFTTKQGTSTWPIYNPITGTSLTGGEIEGTQTAYQPTVELEYSTEIGAWFLMSTPRGSSPVESYKVKVNGADPSPDFLAAKLEAGAGISLATSGDNEHVIISGNADSFLQQKITGAQSTTAIITPDITSGVILMSATYTPITNVPGSTILFKAFVNGDFFVENQLPGQGGCAYVEVDGVCLFYIDFFDNNLLQSPVLSFDMVTGSLSPITVNLRWGALANPGDSIIVHLDRLNPTPPFANAPFIRMEFQELIN